MNTSKILCAAMAAVMTTGMVSGVTASADQPASLQPDSGITAVEGYKKDELYNELIESGYKVRDDGLVYWQAKKSINVVAYIGDGEELVIPAEIDGIPVKSITGAYQLDDSDFVDYGLIRLPTLKKLVIEAPVKEIPYIFTDCKKLESVTLPDTVKKIDDDMDGGCCAFAGCTKLTEVNMPDTVEYVSGAAFMDTPWLKAREEKEGLVIIGKSLLSGRQAKGKVVIPKKVENVCTEAFRDNTGMTELVVPATVKAFSYAIWNTTGLEKLTFKNGFDGLYSSIRRDDAPNLKKVIIPPSFTKAGVEHVVGFCKGEGDWEDYINRNATYYYYKDTVADKVLNNKKVEGYKELKKSVLPGKTKSITVSAKKNAAKVTWKSVSTATGYQIQVSPDKTFKKGTRTATVDGKTKTSRTFKKLKSGKKYYVRMRTYKTLSGKKYFGNFTKARTVTAK